MRLEEFVEPITETSKLTKLKRYVYGLRSNEGVAIISPQNPRNQKLSDDENKRRLEQAKQHLSGKYPYTVQTGMYGGKMEKSFIIKGIGQHEAEKLGRRWEQESIIYIRPGQRLDERVFMFIECFPDAGISDAAARSMISRLVRRLHDVPDEALDNMSVIGGRKFVIPFFDPAAEWEGQFGSERPMRRKAGKRQGELLYSQRPRPSAELPASLSL